MVKVRGLKNFTKTTTSKYRAVRTDVDGIKFDSKKEAKRYEELKLLEKAHKIYNLERQYSYELQPKFTYKGKVVRAITYVADFHYVDEYGHVIVEDVKSAITKKNPVYILKKKMLLYKWGVEIKEV